MSILKVEPTAINTEAEFVFANISVAGNVTVGSAIISATESGGIYFDTSAGAVEFNSNTFGFLSNIATEGPQGAVGYTGSTGSSGALGYTGSVGPIGYTGSAAPFQLLPWTEVTANTTITSGSQVIVNTSSNITVTLPSGPSFGNQVRIVDGTGLASNHSITVNGNGANIQGSSNSLIIDVDRAAFGLVYYNVTQGWVITEK